MKHVNVRHLFGERDAQGKGNPMCVTFFSVCTAPRPPHGPSNSDQENGSACYPWREPRVTGLARVSALYDGTFESCICIDRSHCC